jgi:Lamin Tail Domain
MVNPEGPAPERETVTLRNGSSAPVDLGGWRLSDRNERQLAIPAQRLEPEATVTVFAADGFQLGNRGGTITLTGPSGTEVHRVTYTEVQARREGHPITFEA